MQAPRVYILTLGCAKNEADSRRLLRALRPYGVQQAANPSEAQLLLVNTCGFVAEAKKESVDVILGLAAAHPLSPLVVTGCLVERYRRELQEGIPEVASWFGVEPPEAVAAFIAHTLGATLMPNDGARRRLTETARPDGSVRSYAYVKVSDGCDHRCSFCAIPLIKGAYRAHCLQEVLEEAQAETAEGAAEIVLVGQDTSRWEEGPGGIAGLLEAVSSLERVARVRLMYLHPENVNAELLEAIAGAPKVCRYLDVPFQHSARSVLRRMGRAGCGDDYLEMVAAARGRMGDVSLRSTFIVGFPGETDDDFEELLEFVTAARFDHAGVFAFSEEEGTPAYGLEPRVPEALARERVAHLSGLLASVAEEKNQAMIGREAEIMLDAPTAGTNDASVGRTEGQAPEVDGVTYLEDGLPPGVGVGSLLRVTITGSFGYDLSARCVRTESS